MNSLQLFVTLRATSNFVAKRQKFTQKDRIYLLNRQNKSLYGPVIKTTKPKRAKKLSAPSGEHENVPNPSVPSSSDQTGFRSEMYWILGKRLNGIVDENDHKGGKGLKKVFNANEQTSELKQEKLVEAEVFNDLKRGKGLRNILNAKEPTSKVEEEVLNTITNHPAVIQKPIPLSNEELKNLREYPLQSDVLSTPPTDIRAPLLRTLPSVGRVLQYTMSEGARNALLNWKLAKISELGEQGFAELQQANLSTGLALHSSLQQYFLTNETPIASSPVYKLWESVRGVLDTFTDMPASVEKTVYHPILKYKGICDCVSEVDNELTIIEWKKSGRSKPTLDATYDAPLQLCAYLGAMNCTPEFQGRIRQGMVVIAYENGKPADVYKMNEVMLRKYWRAWLGRLHEFWVRSRDDTLPEPI